MKETIILLEKTKEKEKTVLNKNITPLKKVNVEEKSKLKIIILLLIAALFPIVFMWWFFSKWVWVLWFNTTIYGGILFWLYFIWLEKKQEILKQNANVDDSNNINISEFFNILKWVY